MAGNLLSQSGRVYGTFPTREENTKEPIKMSDLEKDEVITINGVIEFTSEFGENMIMWIRREGLGTDEKVYTSKTAYNKLKGVIVQMGFPYICQVEKGMSEKYHKEWTSLGDLKI